MSWLALLSNLIAVISWLINYAKERKLISEGETRALALLLNKEADAIAKADKARAEASANNAVIPESSSLPDDGFRRD